MKIQTVSFAALMSMASFPSRPQSSFFAAAAKQNGNNNGRSNGNGEKGNDRGGGDNNDFGGNNDYEPDPNQYIVKVGNNKEVDVVNNAKKNNGKFLGKVKRANALVMKFPNGNSAKKFKDMGYEVEVDQPRYFETRRGIRGSGAESGDATIIHRHLEELVPWGIQNVYEDAQGNPNVPPASFFPETTTHPICIIDSGYQLDHPDLPNSATAADPSQASLTENLYFGIDGCKHGSHVAGTIAATGYNDVGVVGVYPNAPGIKIVKVFGSTNGGTDCGWSYTSRLLEAAEHCRDSGAKIISMSLGGGGSSNTERNLFEDLYNDDDILTIAAAGNGGNSQFSYPASYPSIVSVGAIDESSNIAPFSQHNSEVDISGPGVGVLSTGGSDYMKYSGTSMATPHVSGVALVLWNKYPACSNSDIRTALEASAKDLGAPGRDNYYGNGAVRYWAAETYLTSNFACANTSNAPPTTVAPAPPTMAPRPTTPPPVPTPCVEVELELQTDYYGEETSWELRDNGNVIESGSQYSRSALENINLGCHTLDYGNLNRYEFTIKDTYGDGICCSYGEGSYKLKADGKIIQQGGDFGSSESFRFPGGNFRLELQTDSWSNSETSWEIRGPDGSVMRSKNIGSYDDSEHYLHWEHLFAQGCFTFTMKDSYGDGIYYGYYKLFWNDKEVAYVPGNTFSFSETTLFGTNCPASTYSDSGPITVPIRDAPSPGSAPNNQKNHQENPELYKKKDKKDKKDKKNGWGNGNGKNKGNEKDQ